MEVAASAAGARLVDHGRDHRASIIHPVVAAKWEAYGEEEGAERRRAVIRETLEPCPALQPVELSIQKCSSRPSVLLWVPDRPSTAALPRAGANWAEDGPVVV